MQLLKSGLLTLNPYYYLMHGLYSVFVSCHDFLLMLLFTSRWELTVTLLEHSHPLFQSRVIASYLWRKNKKCMGRGEMHPRLLELSRHGEMEASSLDLQMPLYYAQFWGGVQTQDIAREATRLESKGQMSWFCL